MTRISREHAIESVLSETCPGCGGLKPPQNTFCLECLLRLRPTHRQALCLRIGDGYEEALADALDFLQVKEMKLPPMKGTS